MPEQSGPGLSLCPHCRGAKGQRVNVASGNAGMEGFIRPQRWRPCPTCGGHGEVERSVASAYIRRKATGKAMKKGREARGLSLRQEAERLGVDPRVLALMEMGEGI